MDERIKGIVIKLTDYKEADKLASIFSLEKGMIFTKFVGVKRDKAKYKSIAQPFVFADFTLNKKGNNYTITNADVIDTFPKIMSDYNKTICGYIILDIVYSILPKEKPEPELFALTISALKNIEETDEFNATIDYILKFISFSGMGLEFADTNYIYFGALSGNFTTTREIGSVQIDNKVYGLLKAINQSQIVQINQTTQKQALRFLHNVIYAKFNEDIKSFQFI
ncbi:MAG: DNA repair protein RecO [Clostridia bacterium]|nr:DNA repair protein RecO [Clostridia bacterium]